MGGYKNCSDLFSCLVFAYIDSFEFKRTLLNFIKKLIKLRKGTDTYFFLSIKSSWNLNDTKKKKKDIFPLFSPGYHLSDFQQIFRFQLYRSKLREF